VYTDKTSDDLAKGHDLLCCCDPCLELANEMRSFMRQSKYNLICVINSFGIMYNKKRSYAL